MDDCIPEEYIRESLETRSFAEANGLYDNDVGSTNEKMSWEQEMTLHQAMSSLSNLARETNSSISELLLKNGYQV